MNLYRTIRRLVFSVDPERAHRAAIAALRLRPLWRPPVYPRALYSTVAGLRFASPIGLAAGFDKNAEVADEMLSLGFGFVEVGTVTPRPQPGNERPRLFRLTEDRAIINRLGFNNRGQPAAFMRLQACRRFGPIGVNVGANKDSDDFVRDYARGVAAMSAVADYITINISSPNTAGLRAMQGAGVLEELLAAVRESRRPDGPPVFLKVAPDLGDDDPDRIARAAIDHGIDALIVANTTVTRPPLRSRYADEPGGLSGSPLRPLALEALRRFRRAAGGRVPLIGVGGIGSAEDAWERICAGASLVQLYTAMVYEGPGIARRISRGLARRLRQEGMASISEAVGSERA